MVKKLSILIALILLFASNFNAFSQTTTVTFTDTDGNGDLTLPEVNAQLATAGNPASYNAIIANGITSVGITAISPFENRIGLISVTLPTSITTIGIGAFIGCTGLTSITFSQPSNLTLINTAAFSGCRSLNSIELPSSLMTLGVNAFLNCSSLTSINIPNGITTINATTFSGCSGLTSITIPNSVTSIGANAFLNCSSLTSITLSNNLTSIGNFAFNNCSSLTNITFPNNLLSGNALPNGVNSIPPSAFSGCSSLKEITLPSTFVIGGITAVQIGANAFLNCSSLTNVTFPEPSNLTSIPNTAFQNCISLDNITLPNSVTSIGTSAFSACSSLTNITLSNNLTSIGQTAFQNCISLDNITLPNSVTSIGTSAFLNCNLLTNITLSNNLTSIGQTAFQNCISLASITLPNTVTSIGTSAFLNCSLLTSITLPDNLTSIGNNVFQNCTGLTSITLPDNLTSIGNNAFQNCTGLTSITLPDNLTTIRTYAFEGCRNLRIVEFLGIIPLATLETNIFQNCSRLDTIFVPFGRGDVYRARFEEADYDNATLNKIHGREIVNTSPENAGTIAISENVVMSGDVYERVFSIAAIPDACYTFRNWTNASGDIVSASNPFGFIMSSSYSVLTANFDINIYSLSVNADNPIQGRVNGTGNYDCGTNAVLTAYPAEGHIFTNWTDENNAVLSTENPHTIAITNNRRITANFMALPNAIFTLIITPSTGGSVTTNPINTTNLVNGTQVTFTAHPDAGYRFVNWTGENISSTLNPESIIMRSDRTIRANFELLSVSPNTTATLTISTSNGGGVTTNPPNTTNIPIGTEITLTANPNTCYKFKEWSNGSTESQINLTLTSDMNLTAIFELSEATYNLQVTSNGNGTVTGAENNVPCGATRQIRATPISSCYRFTGWSNGSTANPFELDITSDMNLVASFAIVQYNLSVSAGTGGSINISGTNPRDCGSTTSLSATADAGYKFLNWTSGGVEISTDNNLDITIASDTSLVANFELDNGSVLENNLISNAIIYPNPVDKNTTISFGLAASGNMRIVLSDISGQDLMDIHNAFTEAGEFSKTFSLEILPSGAYFIKITHNGSTKIQKAIKK